MLDLSSLTGKQQEWFENYTTVSRFNATDAARRAGYAHPEVDGCRTREALTDVISAYWEANAMPKTEVAARLAQVARGIPAEYWVEQNVAVTTGEGAEVIRGYALDVDALNADGLGYLIKGVKNTANGQNFEIHDSQVALDKLARHHGMYNDKVAVTVTDDARLDEIRANIAKLQEAKSVETAGE